MSVHQLVCKVKLGEDIERDMYKLSKRPQTEQAQAWRKFALLEKDLKQKVRPPQSNPSCARACVCVHLNV